MDRVHWLVCWKSSFKNVTKIPPNREVSFYLLRLFFSFKILFHRENFQLLGRLGGRFQNWETPDQIGRVKTDELLVLSRLTLVCRNQKNCQMSQKSSKKCHLMTNWNTYGMYLKLTKRFLLDSDCCKIKACVRYFLSVFYFSPNNSPSKTMKNVFHFI